MHSFGMAEQAANYAANMPGLFAAAVVVGKLCSAINP